MCQKKTLNPKPAHKSLKYLRCSFLSSYTLSKKTKNGVLRGTKAALYYLTQPGICDAIYRHSWCNTAPQDINQRSVAPIRNHAVKCHRSHHPIWIVSVADLPGIRSERFRFEFGRSYRNRNHSNGVPEILSRAK